MREARFGESRCPACAGELTPLPSSMSASSGSTPLSTGERVQPLSLCASCYGVWFDWWAGETASLSRQLAELPWSTRAHAQHDGACPRDHTRLVPQAYLDKGPVVRRCPRCMGLFAQRAQLDELAKFADRLPEPIGPIEDTSVLTRLWRLLS